MKIHNDRTSNFREANWRIRISRRRLLFIKMNFKLESWIFSKSQNTEYRQKFECSKWQMRKNIYALISSLLENWYFRVWWLRNVRRIIYKYSFKINSNHRSWLLFGSLIIIQLNFKIKLVNLKLWTSSVFFVIFKDLSK